MYDQVDLKDEIFEIEDSDLQKVKNGLGNQPFELKPYSWLLTNLSGNYGALFVRAILNELNINEHHVFKWRLENKFKQYQILNYYSPGCMPESLSFSKLLNGSNGLQKIKELFLEGFFLKATLGDASLFTKSWDKTAELDQILKRPDIGIGKYESYMLQKRLPLKCEFRIHTFSKDIIPCLSYIIQRKTPLNKRAGAETFLNGILQKLPNAIMQGTLIGWDIGYTDDDQYYIIEANFTGFHPEYRAGFQTTGLVDDHYYGAIICAWMNIYFRKNFGVYVDTVDDSLFLNYPFYKALIYYISIFKQDHINLFDHNKHQTSAPVIVYLGDVSNKLVFYLIQHFLLVDFAKMYYVIVRNRSHLQAVDSFGMNMQVNIWTERELFTEDQYLLIDHLSYERRKQFCYLHARRRFKDEYCITI